MSAGAGASAQVAQAAALATQNLEAPGAGLAPGQSSPASEATGTQAQGRDGPEEPGDRGRPYETFDAQLREPTRRRSRPPTISTWPRSGRNDRLDDFAPPRGPEGGHYGLRGATDHEMSPPGGDGDGVGQLFEVAPTASPPLRWEWVREWWRIYGPVYGDCGQACASSPSAAGLTSSACCPCTRGPRGGPGGPGS